MFAVVHVDDVMLAAQMEQVAWFFAEVNKEMKLKRGADVTDVSPVKFLGKYYQRLGDTIQIWLPAEYYDDMIDALGLRGCKAVTTPGVADFKPHTLQEKAVWEEPLDRKAAWTYRHVVGQIRFAVSERPDLLYAAQILSRSLTEPTWACWQRLRRTVRYLSGTRDVRLTIGAPAAGQQLEIKTWTDSDYAADQVTRRSVSCALVTLGGSLIHAHARRQTVVATSSAEAEYYALAGGAVETLGAQAILEEVEQPVRGVLRCDSSSGRALAAREGFGRVKHVDVRMLWLQEVISSGRLALEMERSTNNPADIGTKWLDGERLKYLASLVQVSAHDEGGIAMITTPKEMAEREIGSFDPNSG